MELGRDMSAWRLTQPNSDRSVTEVFLGPVQRRSSRRIVDEPHTHRLPGWLMWTVTLLTAVGMAGINFFSLLAIEYSIRWKFEAMQKVIDSTGLAAGLAMLVVLSCGFSTVGVAMILLWAPKCGGSGLPESKCYWNGSNMPSFFTVRNLIVRIFTSILANAAGFPVGREGPTVTIGGNLAFLVSHRFTMPYVKQWVDLSASVSTVIVEEERFAHASRINCAVGGACAMAMLFNTPIGGLLYMFEEISPAAWPLELTFRAFVATTVCALSSYILLGAVNKEIREFVIFAWLPENKEWTLGDLPIFVVLSAFLGAVTAFHTKMMLAMAAYRQRQKDRMRWPRLGVARQTISYCALCAIVSGVASLASNCRPHGDSNLQYVRFNCPEGEYNPVASLLVNTSHSSVKLLFSGNNEGEILFRSSALAFVAYFALNVGLAGLPVPGGAFTATMLLGGLFGRCVGAILRDLGYSVAVSGVYAVVGASAMLCGFKQMAAAVVLIVVQCVNDFNMTPVVMLSVSIALSVNRAIIDRGHDEEQIERKKLPFLEPEVPRSLDCKVAGDLCDTLPLEAELRRQASVDDVVAALEATKDQHWADFPVLDAAGQCVGIITRAHLNATLKAHGSGDGAGNGVAAAAAAAAAGRDPARKDSHMARPSTAIKHTQSCPVNLRTLEEKDAVTIPSTERVRRSEQLIMARVASGLSLGTDDTPVAQGLLPLDRIMDPTPFTIVEDMPAARFYALFGKVGERAACVTSRTGVYRGIISRAGLIAASRENFKH